MQLTSSGADMSSDVVINVGGLFWSNQNIGGWLKTSILGDTLPIDNDTKKDYVSLTNEESERIDAGNPALHFEEKPPVYVENGSIKVNSKKLEIGIKYHILFENRKYVVVRPAEGLIDLYELAN